MPSKLPKDLYGGWSFVQPFAPETLAVSQIWRKCGPVDALKIMAVKLTGHESNPDYDGYMQGITVNATSIENNNVAWSRTFFITGDEAKIHGFFKKLGYALAYPYPRIQDLPMEEQQPFMQYLMDHGKTHPQLEQYSGSTFYHSIYYHVWKKAYFKEVPKPNQAYKALKTAIITISILFTSSTAYTETAAEIAVHQQQYFEALRKIDIDKCLKPGAICEQDIIFEIKKITDKYMPLLLNHYKELIENVYKTTK